MSENLREIVFQALLEKEKEDVYVHVLVGDVLERYAYLEKRDRSFIAKLIQGTIEKQITIDYVIDSISSTPTHKMKPPIRVIMRMAVYQILYMDHVPHNAAVNEAVNLAKKHGLAKLSGFVNGVLRNVVRSRDSIVWPDARKNPVKYMSIMYSIPERLVKLLIDEQGADNAEAVCKATLEDKPLIVRLNTSKAAPETFIKRCEDEAVKVSKCVLDNAYLLDGVESIKKLRTFTDGLIRVQDISSQLVCHVAGIKAGDKVLDLCAAPGGKSIHAADMEAIVTSCDVSEDKLAKIRENAGDCGFDIDVRLNDASVYNSEFEEKFDVVIADVPCSGLGVMRRKQDIRYRITNDEIDAIVELQRSIAVNAARYVKPGGVLVYSTCTVSRRENEDARAFILEKCNVSVSDFARALPERLYKDTAKEGYLQLYGNEDINDGFFIARFIKNRS